MGRKKVPAPSPLDWLIFALYLMAVREFVGLGARGEFWWTVQQGASGMANLCDGLARFADRRFLVSQGDEVEFGAVPAQHTGS